MAFNPHPSHLKREDEKKIKPMEEEFGRIDGPNGRLAYRKLDGSGPTVVWLGGFRSDMKGTKAEALAAWAAQNRRAFLRFDYSGHGESDGDFRSGTISAWLADARAAIERLTAGPLIVVGSSMGGWIAALAIPVLKNRIAGAVFIAPAPDFTEELVWKALTDGERAAILRDREYVEKSQYSSEPNIITRALIEDGRKHLILGGAIEVECPVRIIQGMADPDVPWRHALKFANLLRSQNVELLLIKSGDHRLSKPHEIARILNAVSSVQLGS